MGQYISHLQTSRKHISVRREIQHNIDNEISIPMKLVLIIKMCINEIYSKVDISKNLI
jgi:hypothetical protein